MKSGETKGVLTAGELFLFMCMPIASTDSVDHGANPHPYALCSVPRASSLAEMPGERECASLV
jgi:hypothetical protein